MSAVLPRDVHAAKSLTVWEFSAVLYSLRHLLTSPKPAGRPLQPGWHGHTLKKVPSRRGRPHPPSHSANMTGRRGHRVCTGAVWHCAAVCPGRALAEDLVGRL